jgi:hypothetical protein
MLVGLAGVLRPRAGLKHVLGQVVDARLLECLHTRDRRLLLGWNPLTPGFLIKCGRATRKARRALAMATSRLRHGGQRRRVAPLEHRKHLAPATDDMSTAIGPVQVGVKHLAHRHSVARHDARGRHSCHRDVRALDFTHSAPPAVVGRAWQRSHRPQMSMRRPAQAWTPLAPSRPRTSLVGGLYAAARGDHVATTLLGTRVADPSREDLVLTGSKSTHVWAAPCPSPCP